MVDPRSYWADAILPTDPREIESLLASLAQQLSLIARHAVALGHPVSLHLDTEDLGHAAGPIPRVTARVGS